MDDPFSERPIPTSPHERPAPRRELDDAGQSTGRSVGPRRAAESVTPSPKPRKRRGAPTAVAVAEQRPPLSDEATRAELGQRGGDALGAAARLAAAGGSEPDLADIPRRRSATG